MSFVITKEAKFGLGWINLFSAKLTLKKLFLKQKLPAFFLFFVCFFSLYLTVNFIFLYFRWGRITWKESVFSRQQVFFCHLVSVLFARCCLKKNKAKQTFLSGLLLKLSLLKIPGRWECFNFYGFTCNLFSSLAIHFRFFFSNTPW